MSWQPWAGSFYRYYLPPPPPPSSLTLCVPVITPYIPQGFHTFIRFLPHTLPERIDESRDCPRNVVLWLQASKLDLWQVQTSLCTWRVARTVGGYCRLVWESRNHGKNWLFVNFTPSVEFRCVCEKEAKRGGRGGGGGVRISNK